MLRRLSVLALAALLLLSPAYLGEARGQASPEVLVSGGAPLTRADVARVIEFYEWALSVSFTPAERETFTDLFVGAWRKGDGSAAKLLKMAEKVLAMEASKLEKIQPEFRDAFLADFNSKPDSEARRVLLGAYQREHGGGAAANAGAA